MAHFNDYDVSDTWEAVVKASERITPDSTDEVRNIVLNIKDPSFDYQLGQSVGLLIPGPHEFGNANHLRLYSIAGGRSNPNGDGTDIELCVRRCFYIDDVSGEQYPGVASNRLCDAGVGATFTLTGPYGSHFRMPLDKRSNLVMIGTGTGIAPFRAFVKQIYARQGEWKGKVRLYYGARNGLETLYHNDKQDDLTSYYDQETFQAFDGLSRRSWMAEENGIQNTLEANAKDIWELIQEDQTYVYLAGLEKIAPTFDKIMIEVAGSESRWNWARQHMKEQGRWAELFYA